MRRVALVCCSAALLVGFVAAPSDAAPTPPLYRQPVDAPVVDPFRPPASRYGPGNRGLEYGTAPGTSVAVVGAGVVTFAGSVAGSLHVTVRHPDDLRTTYSFLARVDVVVGQRLSQGDRVGTTRGHLHLGARRGDAYLDPASLFGQAPPSVRLVPFDEPPGDGQGSERRAIGQLIAGVSGLLGSSADWLRSGRQHLDPFLHYQGRFGGPSAVVHHGLSMLSAWQRARDRWERPCSERGADPPPPTERRMAVLVAGLGSNSREATVEDVDTAGLGYALPDVLRFSYAGGRTPDASDGPAFLEATEYGPADTQTDLRVTGGRLADLIEGVAAEAPGVPIDVYAHSQGGVVVRLALMELEARHDAEWLRRLGLVATLGSPHRGANLASGVHAIGSTASGGALLDAYIAARDMRLDDDGASVAQLSEGSDVARDLAAHRIPEAVRAVSIAARGDLIVPVPSTAAPGATQVIVPLAGRAAHSDLPGSAEANRELRLALAGLPPGCQTLRAALQDEITGKAISYGEDLIGGAGWFGTSLMDLAP